MFAEIIRLLLAAACALFVLSLPLSKTETGATLRRAAGVAFTLAFLPSLIISMFYARTGADAAGGAAPSASTRDALASLGCITLVIIVALVAYGVLSLRSRFTSKPKARDPWETLFNRGGGKRPFTMHTTARRNRGPFSFDADDADED